MFKIFKSKKNNQWYWHLLAKNNAIVCQSEGYKQMAGAIKGAKAVIKVASSNKGVVTNKNGILYIK